MRARTEPRQPSMIRSGRLRFVFSLCLKRSPNRRADGDDGGSAPLLIETVSGGAVPSSRIDDFRSLGAKDGGAPFACRRKPVFGDKTDGTSVVSRKVTLADRGVCPACECGTGRSVGGEPAELSSGPMRTASKVPSGGRHVETCRCRADVRGSRAAMAGVPVLFPERASSGDTTSPMPHRAAI